MARASHERRADYEKDSRRVSYCSECGNQISAAAKTCSSKCRAARSRRLKKLKEGNKMSAEQKDVAARIDGSIDDVTHKVVEQELRPVVREALTQEVFNSIQQMTQLVPSVITALQMDLQSESEKVRQKASELILRYTVGNTPVLKDDPEKHQDLTINFALPRPDSEAPEIEASAVELRECDKCGEDKPETQFIENSMRCKACFDKQQTELQEMLNAD